MANAWAGCADLVVANGATISRVVDSQEETSDAVLIAIKAPAVLAETVTFEFCETATGTFATLNNGTADVAGPAAAKVCEYDPFVFPFWRLRLSGAAAAERTFKLGKLWNAY